LRVTIRFGFQPSARASSWSGAKVDQYWLVLCFGLAERSVYIFIPRNCHLFYSSEIGLTTIKTLDAQQILQVAILLFPASFLKSPSPVFWD
jgi:hypothetical protein